MIKDNTFYGEYMYTVILNGLDQYYLYIIYMYIYIFMYIGKIDDAFYFSREERCILRNYCIPHRRHERQCP